jgi:hypothetical protein
VRLIDRLFEGDTFFASEITVVIPQALSKTFGHA